jgi:hypothetical protein
MASPSKISPAALLPSQDIKYKTLNFDRYVDLENELSTYDIIQFIKTRAAQFKERLIEKVILASEHASTHRKL